MTSASLPRVLAALALSAPAAATTWVVDDNGGPGVDFVNIQDAVDAAVDGDVIEVRDGMYPPFTIDGQALVVRGTGSSVRVAAGVIVTNVAATQRVELVRLQIGSSTGPSGAVVLLGNPGSVRLVECSLTGRDGTSPAHHCGVSPGMALSATQNDAVTLLRCDLLGGYTYYSYYCAWDGAPAIRSVESSMTVLDCSFVGGDGGWGYNETPGDGGDGAVLLTGSAMHAHRSVFRRGLRGSGGGCGPSCTGSTCGGFFFCAPAQHGDGAVVDVSSTVAWKDSTFDSVVGSSIEVAIAPYCLGTYEECPCGNNGAGTAGCEHSFGLGGARLEGVGNASVAADTVTLQVTGLNPSASPTALFFQGTTGSEGILFNDGLLCAGGTIRRMKGKLAQNGAVSFGFGQPGDPLVSAAGNVPPAGATRFYQVWYRNNNAGFCTPQRFNMSNGVEIAWGP